MVRDRDGQQWLTELVQSINAQLKQDREDIITLYDKVETAKDVHNKCREYVLTKFSENDMDVVKQLNTLTKQIGELSSQVSVISNGMNLYFKFFMGAVFFFGSISAVLGGYLFSHLLGKV